MTTVPSALPVSPASAPPPHTLPFRREHLRADGRKLTLYGTRPHDLPAGPDLPPVPPPTPHLRWHPLRREWVAYAAHRQDRTFMPPAEYCPLCPVQPGGLAGEVPFAEFEIAVFDNRFPGLHFQAPVPGPLPVEARAAVGHCEVVVFTSAHQGSLAGLTPERRELLVRVWADRYRTLYAHPDVKFVLPFENRGEEVGVTLHHPHGQIYAFSFLPPLLEKPVQAFREGPVLQQLRQRVGDAYDICGDAHSVAFVPPFARYPYEVWVAPRQFHPGPWTFDDAQVRSFAEVLGQAVARLDKLFDRPMPYILALYAAPKGEEATFAFHAQLYPALRTAQKLKFLAGCEIAAGTFLVDALPEDAAAKLRGVLP